MLYAAFYRAEGMYRGCFNSFATCATKGPYCHSEFVFRWTPDELRQVADNLCGFVRLRSRVDKPVFLCIYIIWGGTVDYRFLTEDSAEEFFRVPAKMMPLDVTFEQEISSPSGCSASTVCPTTRWARCSACFGGANRATSTTDISVRS